MKKFLAEYYYASVSKLNPIHSNTADKRQLSRENDGRRRDLFNINELKVKIPLDTTNKKNLSPEDAIIEMIDLCHGKK